jgi:hypothetical protein
MTLGAGAYSSSYTIPTDVNNQSNTSTAQGPSNPNTVTSSSSYTNQVDNNGINLSDMPEMGYNELNDYKSYDCLFTLACLSKEQQNAANFSMASITNILASSKGNWDDNGARRVKTDFGSYDYFIDDVVISALTTVNDKTGNTLATKISFKVTEPYSMGLFFIAMQQGAGAAGYVTNFQQAPYLLVIEFAGYKGDDRPSSNRIIRYIPLIFINVSMKVTSTGCTYDCEAIPYNEVAFRDQYITLPSDLKLSGADVKTMLTDGENSLLTAIKKKYQLDVQNKEDAIPDDVEIHFPSSQTDTNNGGNAISQSIIFNNLDTNGQPSFPNHTKIFDIDKQIYNQTVIKSIDKTNIVFQFRQNIKIPDVITEVIIRSNYIVDQLTNADIVKDPRGMINWFRIETQIIDGQDSPQLGRQTRKTIFRILPFQVHMSKFLPPGGIPPGYPQITQTVNRIYNYLYTGQNTEVLNIDLDFKFAFFSSIPADLGTKTGQSNPNQGGLSAGQKVPTITLTLEQLAYQNPNVGFKPVSQPQSQMGTQARYAGGGGADVPATAQVRTYQALLEKTTDLMNIQFEIMGDPYYIPSSGMGNQIVPPESFNKLADGSINYQSGEIDIIFNFRTPVDFDPNTGLYKFVIKIDQYSGLYQVLNVESRFNHNKFTQVITAMRRRAQVTGSSQANTIFGQG